jgi:cyclitol oxidoreductase
MADRPTVVLTGASAGIGLCALEALAEEATVVAVSRTPPPLKNDAVHWIRADLNDPEDVAGHISLFLLSRAGGLDGLVHCAVSYGGHGRHSLAETSVDEWDELMRVNVRSQFILTVRLLPLLMRRPSSFIVSVTSDAAIRPSPHRIAYGCSKAASYALFSGLAVELGQSSVSVIQMMPRGQVVTRGLRNRRPPGFTFEGYSSPEIFRTPFRQILAGCGAGMNGQCMMIS